MNSHIASWFLLVSSDSLLPSSSSPSLLPSLLSLPPSFPPQVEVAQSNAMMAYERMNKTAKTEVRVHSTQLWPHTLMTLYQTNSNYIPPHVYNHYTMCRNKDDYTTYNNDDDEHMHSHLVSTSPPPCLHVWASHMKVISSIRWFGHVCCRAECRGWGGSRGA